MLWGLYMRRMWNCIFNMEVFVTKTQKYCSYIFHGIISLNTGDTPDYSNSLIFSWTQPVFDVLSSLIDGLRSLVILKGQIFAGLFFWFWALIHSEYQANFEANSAEFLHITQNFWIFEPKLGYIEFIYQLHFLPNSKFGKKCTFFTKKLVKSAHFLPNFRKKCTLFTKFWIW